MVIRGLLLIYQKEIIVIQLGPDIVMDIFVIIQLIRLIGVLRYDRGFPPRGKSFFMLG
jgi:hypothetical protein